MSFHRLVDFFGVVNCPTSTSQGGLDSSEIAGQRGQPSTARLFDTADSRTAWCHVLDGIEYDMDRPNSLDDVFPLTLAYEGVKIRKKICPLKNPVQLQLRLV